MKQDPCYANVELELESSQDLKPLLDELGNDIEISFHGRSEGGTDFASAALSTSESYSGDSRSPDTTILAFCRLIESISPSSRLIWDNCIKREFDIGFESGDSEKAFTATITPLTLRRVAGLSASIEIAIYPLHVNSTDESGSLV